MNAARKTAHRARNLLFIMAQPENRQLGVTTATANLAKEHKGIVLATNNAQGSQIREAHKVSTGSVYNLSAVVGQHRPILLDHYAALGVIEDLTLRLEEAIQINDGLSDRNKELAVEANELRRTLHLERERNRLLASSNSEI